MRPAYHLKNFVAGVSLGLLVLGQLPSARGDRGSCGLRAPTETSKTSPSGSMMAYEPAQRAIILWNGKEEILFLSTDLSYHSSGTYTEVIPLPGPPVVKAGSLDVFTTLAAFLERRGVSSLDWLPTAPEGTIANWQIATAASLQPASATDRSVTKPAVPPVLSFCAPSYTPYSLRGIGWLVFDDIEIRDYVQAFPPIEYRFPSEKVYYPLEISTMDYGETRIDLFVITSEKLTWLSQTDMPVHQLSRVSMDAQELKKLSPDWSTFMGHKPVVMQHLRMTGDIRKMTRDFLAR